MIEPVASGAFTSPESIRGDGLQSPYHFCTYFDRNYLTRGLALYQSLRTHCRRPFLLWTLCFDEESYTILSRLSLEGLRLIRRTDFEADDSELAIARGNRNIVEYYWTCTPSLPLYVLRQDLTINLITYLDADLFFFSDPQPIFDELGKGSILIIGHRYALMHEHYAETSGIYNVGLITFRRDAAGTECLNWWRKRCNEWCYARFEDGKYGDQKYLDDWPSHFHGVIVLNHPGAGLAPWNLEQYQIEIDVENVISIDTFPLVFFHFHALKVITSWAISPTGGQYRLSNTSLKWIFTPYLKALCQASFICDLPFTDSFSLLVKAWKFLQGPFRKDVWLIKPMPISFFLSHLRERHYQAMQSLLDAEGSIREGNKTKAGHLLLFSISSSPLSFLIKYFRKIYIDYRSK